jgi:Predicted pyridoxal phosphate-dependent enzyme apparently involved in regulation of cell wall biogenesis
MIAQGPEVERFEAEFATLCGTRYAVAVMNGTTALYLALLAHIWSRRRSDYDAV